MVSRKTSLKIRQIHRYLGLFLGLQFLMWTVSGIYFSWTNIDEIHGDHFRNETSVVHKFKNLISPTALNPSLKVRTLEMREINGLPYYWINNEMLYNAHTGQKKEKIVEVEALAISKKQMRDGMKVTEIQLISEVGKKHEYRGRFLPAYVISYDTDEAVKTYISEKDGAFQRVRHRNWRIFDFLWMTHVMDYDGRDNLNNLLLRTFSILGLITALSGFLLWYITSSSIQKLIKRIKR